MNLKMKSNIIHTNTGHPFCCYAHFTSKYVSTQNGYSICTDRLGVTCILTCSLYVVFCIVLLQMSHFTIFILPIQRSEIINSFIIILLMDKLLPCLVQLLLCFHRPQTHGLYYVCGTKMRHPYNFCCIWFNNVLGINNFCCIMFLTVQLIVTGK